MRRKLFTQSGYYMLSFLRMNIDTNQIFSDINQLDDCATGSLFLHEYFHYIQDLTTNYGLSNIHMIVDYMKYANNYIIQQPEGGFVIPVIPQANPKCGVYLNQELNRIYEGNGDEDHAQFLRYHIKSENLTIGKNNQKIKKVIVEYKSNGNTSSFEFGALCVAESMAYIMETECYTDYDCSQDIPYSSVKKITDLIFPEFADNSLNILALCDISLMHVHPGLFFVESLLRIKSEKIEINSPEDIYDFAENVSINFCGATNLNELFDILYCKAKNQIVSYFNDPSFNLIRTWLENTLKKAYDYRVSNRSFPIDIARNGIMRENTPFKRLYCEIGTPLITFENYSDVFLYNSEDEYNSIDYSLLWAIEQVFSVFLWSQRSCKMFEYCSSNNINVDERCSREPWTRVDELNCRFGMMWRHWGLSNYYPY